MSCPICKGESAVAYRPFCSKRCADADLGNWLDGSYAIASEEAAEPDDLSETDTLAAPLH